MIKVIYPVIAAVNFNGKLTILMEGADESGVEKMSLSEVLDSEIEFDLGEYGDKQKPADWDYGNVYKCDIVVYYNSYETECGREYDSEIYAENFKLLHAYNKLP